MTTAIFVMGIFGLIVLGSLVVCAALGALAYVWNGVTESLVITSRQAERQQVIQHLYTTSWWFSEYPDAQHALALAAEELATGRQDSSSLREAFRFKTGRK